MLMQLREGLRKSFDDLSSSFASQLETAMLSADKKLKALDARTGEQRAELQQQVEQLTERLNVRLTQLETDCTTFQDESRKRLDAINDSFTRSLHEAVEAVDKRLQVLTTKVQDEGGTCIARQDARKKSWTGVFSCSAMNSSRAQLRCATN
jgi:DNA anti-recombination protein RmuC